MFNLPEAELPDFVKDEQKLNVLFAPLRPRNVNPKDWDHKISSWRTLITLYCTYNDYSFTNSTLNKVFTRNGRPPSCLATVIDEMLKTGDLQLIDEFLKRMSQTWSGWATDVLIKQPLSWSYSKVRNSLFIPNDESLYVHLFVVKNEADKLFVSIPDQYRNKLVSLSDLLKILNKDTSYIENVKLLIHYLLKQNKVEITTLLKNNGTDEKSSFLIKFADQANAKVKPISEVDLSIHALEHNERILTKNIETLEDQIGVCENDARLHLSKGHRQMAKACLRKKHDLEKRITKKADALYNVHVLLEQMRDSHMDSHVFESYKKAVGAFNTTFKETGLSEDAVENTMLKLGEVLDIHHDIQTALARPTIEDDSDLEKELADLTQPIEIEAEDLDKTMDIVEVLKKLNLNLPDVPEGSPNKSSAEASFV